MTRLSHSLTHGHRPDLFAAITRDTALFTGSLTPLHELAAPNLWRLPDDVRRPLVRQFYKRVNAPGDWSEHCAAQSWLATETETLERARLSVAFDDWEIRQRAERAADLCRRMTRLELMQDYARSVGIDPPEVRDDGGAPHTVKRSRVGCAKRLQCPRWWRRQMRKQYTRTAESHLRVLGLVQRRKQVYASDRAVSWRRERKLRDRAMLQEMEAVSDAGDQLELWEVVERSQANPALRRAELMTRLSGFEDCAKAAEHEAIFITLTTPSAFHRTLSNGSQNPHFAGFSPRDGQTWLSKMWARARAKFKRLSLVVYGFRIAEPHHDGTPHWHMVLFGRPAHLESVRAVLRLVWLSEFSEEAGAQEHRTRFERIRREAGSATGYLAKYVAKNIDGFAVGADFEAEGQDAAQSCDRVAAWASAHGIRQFQQIGGPPVGVWRELRRMREPCDVPAIERARSAADVGDWCAFIVALGGIERGRLGDVRLWKAHTGELSQYDELRAPEVVGVMSLEHARQTRTKVWRVQRKRPGQSPSRSDAHISARRMLSDSTPAVPSGPLPSHLGPVSITVRGSSSVPHARGTSDEGSHVDFHQRGSPWIN